MAVPPCNAALCREFGPTVGDRVARQNELFLEIEERARLWRGGQVWRRKVNPRTAWGQ